MTIASLDWRRLFDSMGHQSLDYFLHSVCEGEIIVKPLDKAFEERTRRWQQSLVAQIIGKAPNFRLMQRVNAIL